MNKKCGLRMAQGGLVQGDERAALYAKYGIKPGGSAPAAQPTPQPVAQPTTPTQKPQAGGLLNQATSALSGRRRQLEAAMNYAEGGIVRGKGGPTDDEVPMRVAGKNVNLSNTEAVLPAKTVQALGGPKAVEALIEQTNGKPPVRGGLRQGGEYSLGGVFRGAKAAWNFGKDKVDDAAKAAKNFGQKTGPAPNAANQGTMYQGATDLGGASRAASSMPKYEGAGLGKTWDSLKGMATGASKHVVTPAKLGLGAAAVGGAAASGFSAGEDMVKAWNSDKLDTVGKIGATAEAAGNAMLSIPTMGMIGRPATKIGEFFNGKGGTMLGQAGALEDKAAPTTDPTTGPTTDPTTGPGQAGAQDFDTNLMQTLGAASQQNGGQVNFNSTKDASEYNPAVGTGVVTRAPGKDGLRSATFIGGPSAGDAARDKQFAEAGYGKDAYGNWMTPGRIADQQKAAAIDARDAKIQAARDARDAENYKAMRQAQESRDPNSTLNSMRDDRMISDLVERTKYGKRSERANATSMLNNLMGQRNAASIAQQRMAHEGGLARERMGHEGSLARERMAFDGKYKEQELGLRASQEERAQQRADALAHRQMGVQELGEKRQLLAEQLEGRRITADDRKARAEELKETHSLIDQMFADKDGKPTMDGAEFKQYVSQFDLNNVPGPDGKPLDRIQALTEAKARYDARKHVVGTAGGAKTYKDVKPIGTREATLRDVLSFNGNGAWFPGQEMVQFDNEAAINPRVVDKYDLDTQRHLGLTGLR